MNGGGAAIETPELARLEAVLGYHFRNARILERALQHASYAHDIADAESNERLEFLGDAVIGLVVAHLLYESHPEWAEGELTRGLHKLVDKRGLSHMAEEFGIGDFLRLGRTEQQSQGNTKRTILADAMEAIIGAIYVDGGLEPVRDLVRRCFAASFEPGAPRVQRDPKTRFQEWVMSWVGEFPTYELISDTELEGDEDRFCSSVRVKGEEWGIGVGRTKRAAERAAAKAALKRGEAADD